MLLKTGIPLEAALIIVSSAWWSPAADEPEATPSRPRSVGARRGGVSRIGERLSSLVFIDRAGVSSKQSDKNTPVALAWGRARGQSDVFDSRT